MYIKRKLEKKILDNLDSREYLAIVGPRQAGKTTLIQKIQTHINNSIYLSFEDQDLLSLFDKDIKLFAKEYACYKYIFIDEFQYSKNGGKNLKYLYDLHPNFKFIISGSSAIDLTVKALKHLVGRVFIYNLYQLNYAEFLSYKNPELFELYKKATAGIDLSKSKFVLPKISQKAMNELSRLLDEFMIWGAYPRVALSSLKEEKIEILKNIYNTYFLRDIRDIAGLIDDYKLVKLIKGLATQTGQLAEYNELGIISGYDYISLKKYLNILEKTFICAPVRPFFKNKRIELVKNPKFYFFDNGLRNYITNNFNSLEKRVDKGAVRENYVFTEFIKRDLAFNFWRTKQKAEVDFIVSSESLKILPIEVKSKIKKQDVSRSFNSFISVYSPVNAVILNNNYIGARKINKTKVFFLPFWLID